ncbi:hypothetical protein IMSHALPRED_006536 [Imshaugia aleurites]|uniref:Uncharacterized protein n=1 Tax=Imshaugia aleurites TaxID=172621 RepID=A0A8H3EJY7_9LECA|nr:hypothetical protein IMSHALPRED_006536 [Imshaugia aleurites]
MRVPKITGTVMCIVALSSFPTANAVAINLPPNLLLQQPSNFSFANSLDITSASHFSNTRLRIRLNYGRVPLRPTSLLMNGVEALATLALEDQAVRIPSAHFHTQAYADAIIDVEPDRPATDVSNEVALLCISWGLRHWIDDREYKIAEVECVWDDVLVAHVYFEGLGYQSSLNATETLSLIAERPGGSGNLSTPVTSANDTLLEAVTPHFIFSPDGQNLPILNVFYLTIKVLTAFAPIPNTDLVETYDVVSLDGEWESYMLFEPSSIRARPPYFEYSRAIETVRQIPGFCLQQGRFAELDFGVMVDGAHVGNGLMGKGTP